jgi:hypothetical protein
LTGALPLSENFEGASNPGIATINMFDTFGYGQWGRLFNHITDNDLCSENTTCSWLWTDYITPTINNGGCDTCPPFGGGFVIKNWIDNSIVSPWVSLASTPSAGGTVLRFRVLGGNFFTTSRTRPESRPFACTGTRSPSSAFRVAPSVPAPWS